MARQYGPRRNKTWFGIAANFISMTSETTFLANSLSSGVQTTVLRTFGEYVIQPESALVALDRAVVTVAIGVVSTDAFGVGVTAMPDPADEFDYPWLYWASHAIWAGTMSADPNSQATTVRKAFDVKSMRKINPRESLAMIVQYSNSAGTPPLAFFAGGMRVLLAT